MENIIKMFIQPETKLTAVKSYGTNILTKEYGELVDFESGCWASVLGHNNAEIIQALFQSSKLLLHTHQFFDNDNADLLVDYITAAAKLTHKYKGTFLTSGTEAVSLSIMLADVITSRSKKLCFNISYIGSSPDLRIPRSVDNWIDLDITNCINCTRDTSCDSCGKWKHINFSELSAFVFEPGNSGGLVICPPQKLINYLVNETRKNGGLVIANEVTTGFGRTGKWFGFNHYDVFSTKENEPDIIAIGKGLGNGYPISGILVKAELEATIKSNNFKFVQSHMNDPLGCAVARKVIEIMNKDNVIEHSNKTGEYLRGQLSKIDGITEIRGRGMMNVAILDNKYSASDIFLKLLQKGIFVGYSDANNMLHLYAPLILTYAEVDILCSTLNEIL